MGTEVWRARGSRPEPALLELLCSASFLFPAFVPFPAVRLQTGEGPPDTFPRSATTRPFPRGSTERTGEPATRPEKLGRSSRHAHGSPEPQRAPVPGEHSRGRRKQRGALAGGQMGRLWVRGHSLAGHRSQPERGRALQKESRGLAGAGGTQDQGAGGAEGRSQAAPSQTESNASGSLPGRATRCISVCAPRGIGYHGERITQERGRGRIILLLHLRTARTWGGDSSLCHTQRWGEGRHCGAAQMVAR